MAVVLIELSCGAAWSGFLDRFWRVIQKNMLSKQLVFDPYSMQLGRHIGRAFDAIRKRDMYIKMLSKCCVGPAGSGAALGMERR